LPSVSAAIEYLKDLERKGRGNDSVHIVDIKAEAKERAKNDGDKPKTRFQVELDDPDLYRDFNEAKDRVITHCHNKTIALSLLLRAWQQLDVKTLDKWLAEGETPF
jgi:hypothetical protein